MTVRKVLTESIQTLSVQKRGWSETASFEAEILLAHVLKKTRAWIVAHDDARVTDRQRERLTHLIRRRARHEPLAYLFGDIEFFGRDFLTDKRALIPRPETEWMVKRALAILDKRPHAVVWDVGTGSGAVAVTIKKERPDTAVIASDVSQDALRLARRNARRLGAPITFVHGDLLDDRLRRLFMRRFKSPVSNFIILANLPYLPDADQRRLSPDVINFEPHAALFAGRDGLAVIRKFLRQVSAFPVPDLSLLIEFDPPQAKQIIALAKKYFPKAGAAVHRDLNGKRRLLEVRPPIRLLAQSRKHLVIGHDLDPGPAARQ